VCKTWHSLVFDGQLWATVDLHAFPRMQASTLLQIARSAGPFVTRLDLSGHGGLRASTLEHVTNSLSVRMSAFDGQTRLTHLSLAGCRQLTAAALHYLLERSPALAGLDLKGLPAVTNETCEVLARACHGLVKLNLARCRSLSGAGVRLLLTDALNEGRELPLTELRLSGIKGVTDGVLADLARAAPALEVLDLSYCRDLHNSSLGAFVAAPDGCDDPAQTVALSARQAGRDPAEGGTFRRRVTRLRHVALSACPLLTDGACAHLAHAVPRLELLELSSIGVELHDDGLVLLLGTTPRLRKLDLEGAEDVSDAVLRALTPHGDVSGQPGRALEHIALSGCAHLSSDAVLALARACPRLRVLEADNTRLTGGTAREFAVLARERAIRDAVIVAIDCRAVGEGVARELASTTRPRLGWRGYGARRLGYLDGADAESGALLAGAGAGQDECDGARVVLKTFFGWQTVDAVQAARQKRRRGPAARREANASGETNTSAGEGEDEAPGRARWWTPGGRRAPMTGGHAALLEMGNERDGCVVM
jgi:F-box/leucine-rich repeat protein 2/20